MRVFHVGRAGSGKEFLGILSETLGAALGTEIVRPTGVFDFAGSL
jgi:hypothetical protein